MNPRLIYLGLTATTAIAATSGMRTARVWAGPYADVASAFDDGDPFDLNVRLDYSLLLRRSAIKREASGASADPNGPIPLVDDLLYESARHTLAPRIELGLFTDLSLSAALPVVVADTRTLSCGLSSGQPSCSNPGNSSTLRDGLLPPGGFDSRDPTGLGFNNATDPTLFRGPKRWGLDQVYLGLAWAPMNQARDDTKPTWRLGGELRLPVGKTMRFDRQDPSGQDGVGRGLYEVRVFTTATKRVGWAEPFVDFWWQAPYRTRDDSQFIEPGFGQKRVAAQQQAGTRFGFEAIAYERPAHRQRVSLDFSAHLEAFFEGRDYTEMWEIFQYAGEAGSGGPLVLDRDPVQAEVQQLAYPGVSNVENYIRMAGRVGVRAELGKTVRFGALFEVVRDQSHFLTFADTGTDRPTCTAALRTNCESADNDVIDAGTEEVNPLHVPLIDVVGHRYLVAGATIYSVLLDARLLF